MKTRWIDGLAECADGYDGFAIDQFGVLHDGQQATPGAADTLRRLRRLGKRVIVLSNSGKRAATNAVRLARFDVGADAYDRVITSGELAYEGLARPDRPPFDRLGRRVLLIHPEEDRVMIDGLGLAEAARVEDADFVLLASLADDQTPARLEPLLAAAARRRLPLVCANPDRVRLTARGIAPSAGSVAFRYLEFGGRVTWIGKPHPLIYDASREQFAAWGAARICAIGDSLEHDVAGGAAAGFDTCFIAHGIHRQQFESVRPRGSAARDALLAHLLDSPHADPVPAPTWAMPTLRWEPEAG